MDVPGTRERAVAGTDHFPATLNALPLGPVKVSLRLKPNKDNPHAVAAFIGARQIGWLSTDWSAGDPHVQWMRRLDQAGIRPRFNGNCRITRGTDRIISLQMPADNELDAVADRLTSP